MKEDRFEITKTDLDLIVLLRIIIAQPDKNIKYSDLKSQKYCDQFTRSGAEYITSLGQKRGLISMTTVEAEDTESELIALTEEGKKYISLVK